MMWAGQHKGVLLLLLLITAQIMGCCPSAAARLLPPASQGQDPHSLHVRLEPPKGQERGDVYGDGFNGVSTLLGSRPPSCEHKCGPCAPCLAIQVPTTTDRAQAQYANYEPEGWKCKCGSAFYNP